MAIADEIIDFELERGRHGTLLGRDDVLAELEMLLAGASRGWVLIKGGPGLGKSALLTTWLKRREDTGHRVPHHFLRRGVEDWDQPEMVKRNLAAQVEALFPELKDPEPRPATRLRELLQRVSKQVLVPRQERLVLLVDGLDEVEAEADGSNPLQRFLPYALPPGVWMLCASRPTYPYLSWLEGLDGVRTIDLDDSRWADSNTRVVREFWEQARDSPRFKPPPLTPAFVDEVVQRAHGNVLYSVKLAEWLEGQPVEKRRAELLPRGLEALLDESWERIQQLPPELRGMVEEGLGVLAVARESLPRSILSAVAGWPEAGDPDRFLKVARAFLLEELGLGSSEKAWRAFHESFRSFIVSKLGVRKERALHLRLAQQLCQWPVVGAEEPFRTSYVLRHGVTHWLKAQQWEQARRLYTDLGYLEQRCRVAGVLSVEESLNAAVTEMPEDERMTARDLYRAIQAGSHALRVDPQCMASHAYNWLRCAGWSAEHLREELHFPKGLPGLRLRHPVKVGGYERALEGHGGRVTGCTVTPDGRRVVSTSWDNTLKVWELETGKELATLEGHLFIVTGCAVTPDGRRVVSASQDKTLRVWELETGKELATLEGHEDSVTGCTVTLDGRRVVSASKDNTLKVWELETGKELATLEGHGERVTGCAVTPDGRRVVSASYDNTLKVWELETGERATLEVNWTSVTGCAVTPDGRRVVSASWDKTLKVWELETGKRLATLQGHGERVTGCTVMPDGRRVVSASWDKTLKVWDINTGQCLSTLHGFNAFTTVAAGTDVICAGDVNGNVWILEANDAVARKPGDGTSKHEPKSRGMPSKASSGLSESRMDLGIVIALPEEFREFLALLSVKPSPERDTETGQLNYTFEYPLTHHRCVLTLIGEMNPGPAQLQTERLLARWSPRTLVMLGIAAGIHSDVRVGDVIIASQVDNYLDSAKAQPSATPEAFEFSLGGTVYHADFDFLTQVRNFEFAQEQAFSRWRQACAQELTELVPKDKVRTALVDKGLLRGTPSMADAHLASGPVVGAAQQFTEWLRSKRDRNLKALEMESAGLMAAAVRRVEPARTLVIRGISDYGDERKKQLDEVGEGALRRYAMRNATRLLFQLLETGVLPGLARG